MLKRILIQEKCSEHFILLRELMNLSFPYFVSSNPKQNNEKKSQEKKRKRENYLNTFTQWQQTQLKKLMNWQLVLENNNIILALNVFSS